MIGANAIVMQNNIRHISDSDPMLGAIVAVICCIIVSGVLLRIFYEEYTTRWRK